jgi:mRNA interferase MazF
MTTIPPKPTIVRGEIWQVDFNPTRGAEIQKVRPAITINPPGVGRLPLHIVVPITDWKPTYAGFPWFVHLLPDTTNGLSKESGADAFQVKSVSDTRFVERLGRLTEAQLADVVKAIAVCIDYPGKG